MRSQPGARGSQRAAPISADPAFVASQRSKADARRARFAVAPPATAGLSTGPRIAWPDYAKISTNKEAAVAAFIERKREAGTLAPGHEKALHASLRREPTASRAAAPAAARRAPAAATSTRMRLSPALRMLRHEPAWRWRTSTIRAFLLRAALKRHDRAQRRRRRSRQRTHAAVDAAMSAIDMLEIDRYLV